MSRSSSRGSATDGVHVNGHGKVCHVIRGLFDRRPILQAYTCRPNYIRTSGPIVQIASQQIAIIANCNAPRPWFTRKPLFILN
ncbi:hypothetical protein EUX53_27130 [Pseudomonas orientalis]|nr:hypothetical protein EUX53_27130 [Pseudomonas orientalis]